MFGNVALVWSVASEGEELTGMTGYTDTYLHEGGSWHCIQAQTDDIARELSARQNGRAEIYQG